MKDSKDFKWERRERERKDIEERCRKEDQWDYEAKREADYKKYIDEKKWKQEAEFLTKMQRDIDNQRYLDDIEFDRYMKKLDYREGEMRALEEKWRKEDQWELESKSKSDYQRFLYEKNLKKW
jgi:hypothetical protein